MASIAISSFLRCTILVTTSAKNFFQQNFNLKVDNTGKLAHHYPRIMF
jgi:hypothetical protein